MLTKICRFLLSVAKDRGKCASMQVWISSQTNKFAFTGTFPELHIFKHAHFHGVKKRMHREFKTSRHCYWFGRLVSKTGIRKQNSISNSAANAYAFYMRVFRDTYRTCRQTSMKAYRRCKNSSSCFLTQWHVFRHRFSANICKYVSHIQTCL